MNIILSDDSYQVSHIKEYLTFNRVEFTTATLYDPGVDHFGRYCIPKNLTNTLLVIDHMALTALLDWNQSYTDLIEFCHRRNHLWVFGTHDVASRFVRPTSSLPKNTLALDQAVMKNSVTLFLDACPTDRCYLTSLKNIRYTWYLNEYLSTPMRIGGARFDKLPQARDFLLTMIKKTAAMHRDILWREIQNRATISTHSQLSFRRRHDDSQWKGDTPVHHNWKDGHPSMDLYRDAYVEIVPETYYKNLYYITEKTIKPMTTKTPFLVVSSAGYLDFLRRQGFQTFEGLIDESYDNQYRVQDRARMMVDQLEYIFNNGAQEFYEASKPILDHNYNHMMQIAGTWTHRFDEMIKSELEVLSG